MSRKAKMPIPLSKGVEVKLEGLVLSVKGPKGLLKQTLMKGIVLNIEADKSITVTLDPSLQEEKQFLGLFWALIDNMVRGVTDGFVKRLEMVGVGFRAAVQGKLLDLQIGLSHPTKLPIPEGLEVSVDKSTLIQVKGTDKQRVGQFAADIRAKRPPEPYKGKGIRYEGEYVRRKAGKTSKK